MSTTGHASDCGALLGLACSCQSLLASPPNTKITIEKADLAHLLAVATLYVESFKEDEMLTLPERMNLAIIEDILERLGRHY